jgi:hypothetical protein
MRFSVACLVVWPELWLTRGDPRLGKRPFIESIALSPYTPISPGALLAYAIPQSSSLSCSSKNHIQTLAHRPLVARRFTISNLPSNRYLLIRSITSQLPTARYSYLWVVSNRHLPLERPPYLFQSIALLQVRTPKGRDSPDRYDNPLAALLFFESSQSSSSKVHSRFLKGLVITNTVDNSLSIEATHPFMR